MHELVLSKLGETRNFSEIVGNFNLSPKSTLACCLFPTLNQPILLNMDLTLLLSTNRQKKV